MTKTHTKIFEMPKWGPYSKKYLGLSKILDENSVEKDDEIIKISSEFAGSRFDFTPMPAIFITEINIPNVTEPCHCHPWKCASDYSFFEYRYDLQEKDKVYAKSSFSRLDEHKFLCRTEFVNNTDIMQNCLVNLLASVEFPSGEFAELTMPKKSIYINATDYDEYEYAEKRPWDEQNHDGLKKGELSDSRFVGGHGLGDRVGKCHLPQKFIPPFGAVKGDRVKYSTKIDTDYSDAVLLIRYRSVDIVYLENEMDGVFLKNGDKSAKFVFNSEQEITFEPVLTDSDDNFAVCEIPLGRLEKGEFAVELNSIGTGAVEFDFLAIVEKSERDDVKVETKNHDCVPEVETKFTENSVVKYSVSLNYKNDEHFSICTFDDNTRFRKIDTGCLEDCLKARLSNSDPTFDDVTDPFTSVFSRRRSDNGFFFDTIVHTCFVDPHSSKMIYSIVSDSEIVDDFGADYAERFEKIYEKNLDLVCDFKLNGEGKKYELSNNILRSTLLMNTVYPLYGQGKNNVHHTPGKRWDCFYTWDSGFIGLGMNEFSPDLAKYILNLYLPEDNIKYGAFTLHGSPVPVQFALFNELLNKSNDKSDILDFYDRMHGYYEFYTGSAYGSTTDKFSTGLLSTYDYFYSSSGMDDYPAQVAEMNLNIRQSVAPAITSSHAILAAKIMCRAAEILGRYEDIKEYRSDISRLSRALNKYSWDEDSGYYSYVVHDENGDFRNRLTTEGLTDEDMFQYGNRRARKNTDESGKTIYGRALRTENANKGLDGVYPIVAGVPDSNQKKKIISHLKSDDEMNSKYGISAVDKSADYFSVNGYWNGNVWISHQWYLFKSMLDNGDGDFAFEIAKKALDIFKRETEINYYTYEMFSVVTGRGGWFHNFGGLSSPINIFADCYFLPGTVTVGFGILIENQSFNEGTTSARVEYKEYYGDEEISDGASLFPTKKSTFVVTMSDKVKKYKCILDEHEVDFVSRFPGEIEISRKAGEGGQEHILEIFPMEN